MKAFFVFLLIGLLTAAGELRAQYESPGLGPDISLRSMAAAERPWKLWARAFAGHDDNVAQIGEATTFSGERGSDFIGMTVEGSAWVVKEAWIAGVALRFDQMIYTEEKQSAAPPGRYATDANDFNFTVWNPAVFIGYQFKSAPLPLLAKVVYDYRSEAAETEGGWFQTLAAGVEAQLAPGWTAELIYAHGWDDHGVTYAFSPGLNDRDGQRDGVTLRTAYLFNQKRSRVSLGYGVLKNDSDGPNFAYEGQSVNLRLESMLVGPLFGAVEFGYGRRDYINGFSSLSPLIPPPGRTKMDLYSFGLQLLWKLSHQWSVDTFWNYTSYEADSSVFDSDRNIVGAGIRFDF
jgi:hypothetical protein